MTFVQFGFSSARRSIMKRYFIFTRFEEYGQGAVGVVAETYERAVAEIQAYVLDRYPRPADSELTIDQLFEREDLVPDRLKSYAWVLDQGASVDVSADVDNGVKFHTWWEG
jgi:hypothetical protein